MGNLKNWLDSLSRPRYLDITRYEREKGVICYEGAVLWRLGYYRREVIDQLIQSSLDCYWTSALNQPPSLSSSGKNLPTVRPLTRLDPTRAHVLLEDLQERTWEGEGRTVALFALDGGADAENWPEEQLQEALTRFGAQEMGPIRMVVFKECDSLTEAIFVPHEPTRAIQSLLTLWRITPSNVTRTARYKEDFDSIRDAAIAMAFGREVADGRS